MWPKWNIACVAAALAAAGSLAATDALAGGGGRGGGHAVSAGRSYSGGGHGQRSVNIGRSFNVGRSFSAAQIGRQNSVVRSFSSGNIGRFVARSHTQPTIHHSAPQISGVGNRFTAAAAASKSIAPANLLSHPHNMVHANAGLGRHAIANVALRSSLARASIFHGRFHGSHFHSFRRGFVIGWIGPLFWPYAYYDFFDYVFWPYAYDDFWPYAYDDVYYGIYGAYAGVKAGRPAAATGNGRPAAGICNENVAELTNWPIERISQIVEPTEAQRAALDELKSATAQAVEILKGACPNDLPSIPTGRLAAMKERLQVMLAAVQTVRPALERFYQSLNDEQKARFNAVAPADASAADDRRDLTKLCSERAAGIADLPIDRIAQALRPTAAQQSLLDELRDASAKAADGLRADCPTDQALTPTGRTEAMEKRLEAMLAAVKTVQPALTAFYGALNDEQKARFNTLGSSGRPQG